MKVRNLARFIILLSLCIANEILAEKGEIVLSSGRNIDNPVQQYLNKVYSEAFKRLNLKFIYREAPWARSSFLSDSGDVDGELTRVHSYGNNHPNVIRVNESHYTNGVIALSNNPKIKLKGWESFSNTDYRVLYVRGAAWPEIKLPKYVKTNNLSNTTTTLQGIQMLISDRTDVFVASEITMFQTLYSGRYNISNIWISGVMQHYTGHMYLHKKHIALVPKLETVLKIMKKEGLLRKFMKDVNYKTLFKEDGSIKSLDTIK